MAAGSPTALVVSAHSADFVWRAGGAIALYARARLARDDRLPLLWRARRKRQAVARAGHDARARQAGARRRGREGGGDSRRRDRVHRRAATTRCARPMRCSTAWSTSTASSGRTSSSPTRSRTPTISTTPRPPASPRRRASSRRRMDTSPARPCSARRRSSCSSRTRPSSATGSREVLLDITDGLGPEAQGHRDPWRRRSTSGNTTRAWRCSAACRVPATLRRR